MRKTLRKIVGPVLQAAATVLLVGWILRRNDASAVFGYLRACDPGWFLVAVAVMAASIAIGVRQWRVLLEAQAVAVPRLRLFRAYNLGMFLNFVLPSGVGGDVVRAVQIHREAKGGTRGVAATLLDRMAGLFTLALFASVASWLLAATHPEPLFKHLAWASGATSLLFCIGAVVLFSRRIVGWISPMARWLGEGALLDRARDLRHAFLHYRSEPGVAIHVVALSVATQFLRILVHWCCARALGLPLDFAWILLFVPIVALISILPISVGGWGLREGSQKTFFSLPGVMPGLDAAHAISGSLALAVSTSLLGMLVPAVFSLASGLLLSWRAAQPGRNE